MKHEKIQLIDDLSGGDAQETLRFSLDGTFYEIDLNEKNATKMRRAFSAYITGGRRVRNPYKMAPRYVLPLGTPVRASPWTLGAFNGVLRSVVQPH